MLIVKKKKKEGKNFDINYSSEGHQNQN